MIRLLLLLACTAMLQPGAAVAQPRLITSLSETRVEIAYSFAGVELLLFGAVEGAASIPGDVDLVATVRGPEIPAGVRKKERIAGVWMNTRAVRFRTVPSFYSISSTRPLDQILEPQQISIHELRLEDIYYSPAETEKSPNELQAFEEGLIRLQRTGGLYREEHGGVTLVDNVLYRADVPLPADVPVGDYLARVYLVTEGEIIATTEISFEVDKSGFERAIYEAAHERSFSYGVLAVALALLAGWTASQVFRRL